MRLPHKEPLLFAKRAISSDENSAVVEVEFGSVPTLAMTVEAAAQAFSFIEIESDASWGVVAMIKDTVLSQKPTKSDYLCEVAIAQAIDPYYKVSFKTFSADEAPICSGELSIKIL
jgi:hypothetical protein